MEDAWEIPARAVFGEMKRAIRPIERRDVERQSRTMDDAWTTDDEKDTRSTSQIAVSACGLKRTEVNWLSGCNAGGTTHVGSCLFVSERDKADADGDASFCDLDNRNPHQAEEDGYVLLLEGLGDELGARE